MPATAKTPCLAACCPSRVATGNFARVSLWRFPFDKLKIDPAFTQNLDNDHLGAAHGNAPAPAPRASADFGSLSTLS
jgi:hypothetical protein